MIDITKLTTEDVGRWVVYLANKAWREEGRIKDWNDKYIFVVYTCDNNWDHFLHYTGVSTRPGDLSFLNEGETIE